MTFVNGMIYGSGFTLAAILVATAMHKLFGMGVCG